MSYLEKAQKMDLSEFDKTNVVYHSGRDSEGELQESSQLCSELFRREAHCCGDAMSSERPFARHGKVHSVSSARARPSGLIGSFYMLLFLLTLRSGQLQLCFGVFSLAHERPKQAGLFLDEKRV